MRASVDAARVAEQLAREREGGRPASRRRQARGRGMRAPGRRRAQPRGGASPPRCSGTSAKPAMDLLRDLRDRPAPVDDDEALGEPLRERPVRVHARGARTRSPSRSIRSPLLAHARQRVVGVEPRRRNVRSGRRPPTASRLSSRTRVEPEPAADRPGTRRTSRGTGRRRPSPRARARAESPRRRAGRGLPTYSAASAHGPRGRRGARAGGSPRRAASRRARA